MSRRKEPLRDRRFMACDTCGENTARICARCGKAVCKRHTRILSATVENHWLDEKDNTNARVLVVFYGCKACCDKVENELDTLFDKKYEGDK